MWLRRFCFVKAGWGESNKVPSKGRIFRQQKSIHSSEAFLWTCNLSYIVPCGKSTTFNLLSLWRYWPEKPVFGFRTNCEKKAQGYFDPPRPLCSFWPNHVEYLHNVRIHVSQMCRLPPCARAHQSIQYQLISLINLRLSCNLIYIRYNLDTFGKTGK